MTRHECTPRGRRRSALLAILLLASATVPVVAQDLLSLTLKAQVIASDRAATSDALAAWADSNGGYFTYRSLERVTLRIPAEKVAELRPLLESLGDEVIAYNPSTTDMREQLRDVKAAIASRRESLDRILTFVANADTNATLEFEREMRSLNGELETFVGRERVINNDAAYAHVDVALSARERSIPVYLPSSFGWINRLGLYGFISDMQAGGSR